MCSLFAIANERSTHVTLGRLKHHNALDIPANLTGLPNIYRSAQISNVLQSRRQRVVQPPSSCPNWFKSVLDKQDSLRICHDEPVKITEASIVLHTLLMNQVESERIANAIKLDDNKKELKIECAIEAEANSGIKSKGEITGQQ